VLQAVANVALQPLADLVQTRRLMVLQVVVIREAMRVLRIELPVTEWLLLLVLLLFVV
jgi:hypothetical protein